jgi:hypothetical protein
LLSFLDIAVCPDIGPHRLRAHGVGGYILAAVFAQGVGLREDLEATI